jgi:hypothetical protein
VLDCILSIFIILYNTTGMSHLKVILQNVTKHLPTNTVPHPRQLKSSLNCCQNHSLALTLYSQVSTTVNAHCHAQKAKDQQAPDVNYDTFWYISQLVHRVMIHVQLCPLKCESKFLYPNVHIPSTQTSETDSYHVCVTQNLQHLCYNG